jgi:hypothetical protein
MDGDGDGEDDSRRAELKDGGLSHLAAAALSSDAEVGDGDTSPSVATSGGESMRLRERRAKPACTASSPAWKGANKGGGIRRRKAAPKRRAGARTHPIGVRERVLASGIHIFESAVSCCGWRVVVSVVTHAFPQARTSFPNHFLPCANLHCDALLGPVLFR